MSLGEANVATRDLDIIQRVLPFINDRDYVKRAAVVAIGLIGYGDDDIRNSVLIHWFRIIIFKMCHSHVGLYELWNRWLWNMQLAGSVVIWLRAASA